MSTIGTIARRSFLIGSAAIAGGVAFGVYVVKTPHANPLADGLAEGEATFNPWVKIGPESITLIAPHTDLGQGARSIQAALIAEELDLEFGGFEVETGPTAPAYYNTAGAEEGVPFMPRDKSAQAEFMRGTMGALGKVIGAQVTGGSSTVPDSFVKLRKAGAMARETLKKAASMRTGLAPEELSTENGAVVLPDGTRLAYTDLAAEAAGIDPVADVPLRDPSTWRLLGTDMMRLDVVAKSTGTLTYGIDLRMEGMVYAAVRLNPRRGTLEGYDASAAEAIPGVSRVLEVTSGLAVIANNTWTAFKGAEALEPQWGAAPYPAEMADHWAAIEASFVEERLDREWLKAGDVTSALAGASETVSAEYRAPYLAHAPLEPISAMIKVTDTRVDLWVAHQLPRFAQDIVAQITGLPASAVVLHNQYAGGSFGHRLEFENVRYAAEIGRQMKGVPIKLTFRREEDMAWDFPRHIGIARATGAVRDGKVEALDIAVASPSVTGSQFSRIGLSPPGPDNQLAAGVWTAPYAIPNLRVRTYRVPELAPVSSWRSVGASSGGFYMETAMDELIHAAGADPLEERLRLCNYDVARGVLEAVGEMSNWGSALGPNQGRGLALVISFGVPVAEVVEVTNTSYGIRIDKVYVAADVGPVLDPVNFDNHVKGAVVWGLGHAMNCETTYADGMAEQTNFDMFQAMRLYQCPDIEVRAVGKAPEIKGIGEPPVPPAAPALANAIFAATGTRLREMPFNKTVDFV